MTKTIKKLTALLFSATILILLGGCSSTEIIDSPQEPAKKGKTITLSLSAPENASTRAGSDHKLRYVAKLASGKLDDASFKLQERKESIVSEGENTTITFSVEEGEYMIILFADYIPNNSTPDEHNCYPDYYYNTNYTDKPFIIDIKSFELNNDNMDCFGNVIKVKKGPEQVTKEVSLKRLVSKIRLISTTGLDANKEIDNISYSKIPYYPDFNLEEGGGFVISSKPISYSSANSNNFIHIDENNKEEYELFYFYSLADKNGNLLSEFDFTFNFKDNTSLPRHIDSGIITSKRNTITTIKGDFLSKEEPKKGDIILNLSTPDNWVESDPTIWKAP